MYNNLLHTLDPLQLKVVHQYVEVLDPMQRRQPAGEPSTPSIAMVATVSQYGWATAADWDKHRQTITNLYYHQNKKLREVKVIMEQEHHFFAT